jgi:hypothetical protein
MQLRSYCRYDVYGITVAQTIHSLLLCQQQLDVENVSAVTDTESSEAGVLAAHVQHQQQQHLAEQCSASAEARQRLSALTTTLAAATAAAAVQAGLHSAATTDSSSSSNTGITAAASTSSTTAAVEAKLEALRCELASSSEHRALLSAAAADAAEQTALSLEQGLLTDELTLGSDALLLAGELSSYSSDLAAVLAKLDRLEVAGNSQLQAPADETEVTSNVLVMGANAQSAAAGA